ncbi:MAG: Efflux pump periplasmic linker BepD [Verrucomicrobia subdivision 3 bacterium]|nr:Efflux pump periplasmic linker BepD [Limisphaerales bacterium]
MSVGLESSGRSPWLPSVAVAGLAVAGYGLLVTGPETMPEAERRPPKMVKTVAPKPSTHGISVTAYGAVLPARQVVVYPQVSGVVLKQHSELSLGGFVAEGEDLFEIDSRLMQLDVRAAAAAVARSEALLKEARRKRMEAGRLAQERVIASTELAALESAVATHLAEWQQLQAVLERNEELLRRHVLRAPFNAVVLAEAVETGQRVGPGFSAVTLAGTDEFWVRVSLSADKLRWIKLPKGGEEGARADIYLEVGDDRMAHRKGKVVRLLSDIERDGRMARVLVSVKDPLGFGGQSVESPLLIGSYVRVEIDAGKLNNVLAVQRDALREGDKVWISDANDELQIRDVEVRWRRDEMVYLSNVINPGDSLIVSPLRAVLPGMKLNPQPVAVDEGQGGLGEWDLGRE